MPDLPANQPEFAAQHFAAAAGVSRETLARFKAYVELLRDWNARHNMVSAASLQDVWRRHVWDSAQLAALIPSTATSLVDLGSGAGFPGLVLATLMSDRVRVTLYEATAKKCDFLHKVAAKLELKVDIRNSRIEDAGREIFDVITARACARLAKLLGHAQHFAGPPTICLFLKGQNVGDELTEARKYWKMQLQQHPSLTDPSGRILEIRELAHVVPTQAPAHPGRRQPKGRRR